MYVADMLYSRAFLIARYIPGGSDPSGCRLENTSSVVEGGSHSPNPTLASRVSAHTALLAQSTAGSVT